MSRGVLVLAEHLRGEARPLSFELIAAGRALSEQGAGPLAVALIGADLEAASSFSAPGVQEVLAVRTPVEAFEAHVWQAAAEGLIAQRAPSVLLAGHTVDSLGFAAALAAAGRHGFASDVTELTWDAGRAKARRGAFGEHLVAELEFPGKDTVVLLLRAGAAEAGATAAAAQPATAQPGAARCELVELDLAGRARTERLELREAPPGDVDITKADFLLSIGRGVGEAERIPELERLAEKLGATLSASRPLVDAGWMPSARQVGQSGRTVAPKVYLALGISGAVQHLQGISNAGTVIAINSDPLAPIFGVADYGAVADLFDVAAELERLLAET
ncbi:MAG: electron transfer flavoprotein subunit alpha/FixB family protein [Solirubrobacteraceae bacterium]